MYTYENSYLLTFKGEIKITQVLGPEQFDNHYSYKLLYLIVRLRDKKIQQVVIIQ
jgi:hypothetical protein